MSERDELVEDFRRFLAANYPCTCEAGTDCDAEREEAEALVKTVEIRGYRKPRTITTAEALDEAIRGAFEEGEHLVLMTGERPWDIWEDEDGGLHVSSSPYEDDPERLTLANIALPATVLWEPR